MTKDELIERYKWKKERWFKVWNIDEIIKDLTSLQEPTEIVVEDRCKDCGLKYEYCKCNMKYMQNKFM